MPISSHSFHHFRLPQALSRLLAVMLLGLLVQPASAGPPITVQKTVGFQNTLQYTAPTLADYYAPVGPGQISAGSGLYNYSYLVISADTAGTYTFETTANTILTSGHDTMLFLYSSFAPGNPLVNMIVGDDDYYVGSTHMQWSKFTAALTAGGTYTLVVTSWSRSDTGTVEVQIAGPGNITFHNTAPDLVRLAAATAAIGVAIRPGAGGTTSTTAGALDVQMLSLNSGNGNYAGSTLSVARHGGASANDIFDFNTTTGATFTKSGANLQSGGNTFATFASSAGTLTINFTSSGTTANHALLQNVLQHITYQNSADLGPVTLDWTFNDGNTGSQGVGGALTGTASQVVTIQKATPTISPWPTASAIVWGQTLADSILTGGTPSTPGSFAFTSPTTQPNASSALQSVTFTPTDTTHYSTVVHTVSVTVNKADPTLTWPTASAITYGQTLAASTLSGGSAVPTGIFGFASPSTAPSAGQYSANVVFTPADTANYNSANSTVTVTVNKALPSVSGWPTPSAIISGQALALSTLSGGGASVAGSFAFNTPGYVPAVGIYSAAVTFIPSDSANFQSVGGSVNVPVNKVTTLVTDWPVPAAITYGQTLAASTLVGGAGSVAGTFSFDAPTTMPAAGPYTAAVTFTPTDSFNYTTASGSVSVTVNKATPSVTTWPTASGITYGQTLAASLLSGGSPAVPGSFAFTSLAPAPGAGIYSAGVTFTPDDTANYTTTSGTVNVTVGKATATIDLAGLSQAYDGTPRVVTASTTPSGLTVNITYNGSGSAPTAVGSYPIVATVSDVNYQGTASVTLVVGLGSQTITFSPIADQLATATLDLSASASSGLPVSFSVSGPATLTGGNHLSFTGTGTVTITANQTGDGSRAAAAPVQRTFAVGSVLATVTLTDLSQVYTGGPVVPTVTTSPAGLAVTLRYNGSASAPVDPGSYAVTAAISAPHYVGSTSGTLVVSGAPVITSQPQSVNAKIDGQATFWVGVAGASPLSYQWRWNGTNIAGANGDSITLTNLVADQSGDYDVVVVNHFGAATSLPAALRVSTYVLWGQNGQGQSTPDSHPMPRAVALGWYHTLNLLSDGTVIAWGGNTMGQCNVPAGLSNVVAICGGAYHSLALKADGTVVAWGQDWYGQLAIPEGLRDVVAVSAGEYHNLALKRDGTVAAWGYNIEHQCAVPAGLDSVVAVAAGGRHSLALRANGTVVAWGDNTLGQCAVPPAVGTVTGIAAGTYHNMALRTDGTLYGWGDNRYLQLHVPLGLDRVVKVACGDSHTLALREDGTVVSWGHSQWLQSDAPAGLTQVKDIAAGGDHSAVLLGEP